jgi:hypothetical protein
LDGYFKEWSTLIFLEWMLWRRRKNLEEPISWSKTSRSYAPQLLPIWRLLFIFFTLLWLCVLYCLSQVGSVVKYTFQLAGGCWNIES